MVVGSLASFFGAVIALVVPPAGSCAPGSFEPLRSPGRAYAGIVHSSAIARVRPGGAVVHRFGRMNANRHVTVLGILGARRKADCSVAWYRVQLPLKPNGITAWVRAGELELAPVRTSILIDLSERRLVLRSGGKQILETSVAVGSPATPTPVGHFYVNQRFRIRHPGGPFGPGAVGFSAFSEVLTNWPQGGPVAIHGTNQPQTIGQARSNGCLRVRNDVLPRILAAALPGTPVVVRP